jgi:hypothetical protein
MRKQIKKEMFGRERHLTGNRFIISNDTKQPKSQSEATSNKSLEAAVASTARSCEFAFGAEV